MNQQLKVASAEQLAAEVIAKAQARSAKEAEALRLMQKAKMHVAVFHCFYGALLERLKLKTDWRHDTMYTDAVVIGGNPDFVLSKSWDHLVYIMIHEVTHCALGHPFRRKGRIPRLWRQATDHVVNLTLNKDPELRKMFPSEGLADSRFEGFAAEQVYSMLLNEEKQREQDKPKDQPPQGEGNCELAGGTGDWGDCCDAGASGEPLPQDDNEEKADGKNDKDDKTGSGAGSAGTDRDDSTEDDASEPGDSSSDDAATGDGEGGGADDDEGDDDPEDGDSLPGYSPDAGPGKCIESRPELDAAQIEALAREWEEALMTAQLSAGGDIDASLARSIGTAVQNNKSFLQYVDEFAARCCACEDSWQRPNRRFAEYLPSRCAPGVKVLVLGIDTSGSISNDDLGLMEQCAQRIMDEYQLKRCYAVYCDTAIRGVDVFESGEQVSLANAKGGGGTRFHPVLRYTLELEQDGEEVAGVMYLTDTLGQVNDAEDFAHLQILWISTIAFGASRPPPGGLGQVCSMRD